MRAAAVLARLLAAGEREVVLGDLTERSVSGGRAAVDVLGLVVRRQGEQWKHPGPWFALLGVYVVGAMLSMESLGVRRMFELNFWLWQNYPDIDPKILHDTHLTLGVVGGRMLFQSAMLVAWSWTGGLAIASLSKRAVWINGALFCLTAALVHRYGCMAALALVVAPAVWGMLRKGRSYAPVLAAMLLVTMLFAGTRNLGWLRALPAMYLLGNRVYEATTA